MPSLNIHPLIATPDALTEMCQQLEDASWFAIDTEFMREKTYYPELCLIQIANTTDAWCIDPLAITDLAPLKSLLIDRGKTKVFHAASQDMELLYYLCGDMPGPVFDTQIAASMLGHGEQIGYGNLVKELLNLELDKSQSRTDWSRRPLSQAQLHYAAEDVIYLQKIYVMLLNDLIEKGRLDWLAPDFAQLESLTNFQFDPDALLKRVKGQQRLNARQLAVVREIAVWREERSKKANRPRKWILSDDIVCDIAKQGISTLKALGEIRGISESTVRHHGAELLECISTANALPESEWPKPPKRRKTKPQDAIVADILQGLINLSAFRADISPNLLASRKDLEKVIQGETGVPLMQGWRLTLAGHNVAKFLEGKTRLGISEQGLEQFDIQEHTT